MTTITDLIKAQEELRRQAAEIEQQINQARKSERAEVVAKVKQLMADNGLTVADLGLKDAKRNSGSSALSGTKVAPKYRNLDTGETWTGRGLQPKWIQAAIQNGKKLEDFAIV